MKLKSSFGWIYSGNGTDVDGFRALPGGYRAPGGSYSAVGGNGNWWSATIYKAQDAWYRRMTSGGDDLARYYYQAKSSGFSLRCLKDD